MKIIVTAVGSSGDIQAFVALAESLKKAGHTVKVCSYDIYKRKFDKISVPFAAVGPTIDERRVSEVRDNLKQLSPLKQLDYLVSDVFLYQGEKFYKDCIEASKGYHFGVCHSLDFIGQHVMIQNHIPWASVILTPGIIPTDYSAPMFLPDMGKLLNRAAWRILDRIKSRSEQKIQQYLYQLSGVNREINALGTFSPYLNLVTCSKYLKATYPDLPENFVVTGGWYVREGIYDPPPEIVNFVENGSADVVFTLGSMEKEEGEKTSVLFLKTIERGDLRGIIQQGWAGELPKRFSENVLFVDFNMPHHYLFRQTKLVVHSGGSETTLEACKAGAVSITIPALPDQKYWGKLLYEAGVGSRPITSKRLSPEPLANKIHKTLINLEMQQNAQALASKIREEEGTKTAVNAIEDIVYHIK